MDSQMDKFSRIRFLALAAGLLGAALMMGASLADAAGLGRDPLQIGPVQFTVMGCGLLLLVCGIFILWLPVEQIDSAANRMKDRVVESKQERPLTTTFLIVGVVLISLVSLLLYSKLQHADTRHLYQPMQHNGKPAEGTIWLGGGQIIQPIELNVTAIPVTDSLDAPIGIAHAGDGSGRLFILEKAGRIRIVNAGNLIDEPFLDIQDRVLSSHVEQGLLGLAFDPDYRHNGFFYVNYTDHQGDTVIARYSVGDQPDRADPDSEAIILKLDQPDAMHNGGALAFGPDGYLYIAVGDGGGAFDPFMQAQNNSTLMGAILRMNISEYPYKVPDDNPYVGASDAQDEIWLTGLRNPWRFSFDRLTGDLYIGDVGQDLQEEINVYRANARATRNFGWPIREGFYCLAQERCNERGFESPLIAYDHHQGCAVTGGYVYRGSQYPDWQGTYFFADYCIGRVWGFSQEHPESAPLISYRDLGIIGLASFGENESGELYVVSMAEGSLYRLAVSD